MDMALTPASSSSFQAQDIETSLQLILTQGTRSPHIHVPAPLQELATVGLCQHIVDFMCLDAESFLQGLRTVMQKLDTHVLPDTLRNLLQEAVFKGSTTAPGTVMLEMAHMMWTAEAEVLDKCRLSREDLVALFKKSLDARIEAYVRPPSVLCARNMMRLWKPLLEQPVLLVLYQCDISPDGLGASRSARADIVLNIGVLRRLAKDNRVDAFRGPDWLRYAVRCIKREERQEEHRSNVAVSSSSLYPLSTSTSSTDDVWNILQPVTFENVIDDLNEPSTWLDVNTKGVEFEETGYIGRDGVFKFMRSASKLTEIYSFDPLRPEEGVRRHFDDDDDACEEEDEDEDRTVAIFG